MSGTQALFPGYIDATELAARLGVHLHTVHRWVYQKRVVPTATIHGKHVWSETDAALVTQSYRTPEGPTMTESEEHEWQARLAAEHLLTVLFGPRRKAQK